MTREEAIEIIRNYDVNGCGYCHQGGNEVEEAFDMAIKALSAEPCEDAISREYILSKSHICCSEFADNDDLCVDVYEIEDAPSVQPKPIECEDCISREAVLDGINQYIDKAQSSGVIDAFISFETLVVKELPSIQPKPKMGHWKKLNVGYGCSECSLATNKSGVDFYRFCPNCGAKMTESEEV